MTYASRPGQGAGSQDGRRFQERHRYSAPSPDTQDFRPLFVPRFGAAYISTEASGLFQFNPKGRRGIFVGAVNHLGRLVDVVAFHLDAPGRWWTKRGAVVALGEPEIDRSAVLDLPLHLFATPYDWLLNHETGGRWPAACIVDWTCDPRPLLSGVSIVCDSPALVRRLEDAQRRHDRPLQVRHFVAPVRRAA